MRRALLLAIIYFVIFGYPPLRMLAALGDGTAPGSPTLALILSGPALGWLAYRRWKNALTRTMLRTVYTWMGMCFIALPITALWEIPLALGWLPSPQAGMLLATLVVATCAFALVNAQRLRVRRVVVHSPRIPAPLTIAHVSDVHVGSRLPGFLDRVVRRVNALKPDVVAITGDLVDFEGVSAEALAGLGRIEAPAWFSIGNHERYVDCDAICERVASHGVTVLRNAVSIDNRLRFVGIDDAEDRHQVSRQLAAIPLGPGPFTVLLYHRPDDFEAAAAAGVDLMLCGHTHNGQIAPFNLLVRRVFPRVVGVHEHEGATLHVSPGTGTWGPVLRLGSVNEITLVELRPEAVTAR